MLEDDRKKYNMGSNKKINFDELSKDRQQLELAGLTVAMVNPERPELKREQEQFKKAFGEEIYKREVKKINERFDELREQYKLSGKENMNQKSLFNRAEMKEGGPGIEALRKVAPEVVERMGYADGRIVYGEEEGFDVVKDFKQSKDAFVTRMAEAQIKDVKNKKDRDEFIRLSIKDREKVAKQYNVQEDLQADIKAKVREMAEDVNPLMMGGRQIKAEGGSMDDQMLMVMTPPMESEMETDGEMEDGYTRFIMEEALSEDEEDMLMSKLEQDEELAMLFDKVIDVAQEFAGSGPVEGPGSGVSDSIPARLSDGEFVFTAKAVEEIGEDTLMSMMKEAEAAADERQGFAEGEMVEDKNVNVQAEALLGMDMAPNPTQEAINENMIKYQPYVRS